MDRIVIVEDDPAISRGLYDNLRQERYEVLTAGDGEAGYRLIRDVNPDLIVMDLMLPRLSGYDLCRRVRSEGLTTPIVMLSARADEADRVLGLDLGADDYVTKPFALGELFARIRAILRQRREWRGAQAHLEHDMRAAADVQRRLLPQARPALASLDYCGCCHPALAVGGDAFDHLAVGPGRVGLLVADISGKGMPAALLMASLQACVRIQAPLAGTAVARLAESLNALLYEVTDAGRYATMFYSVYDDACRELTYVNAGHPPPILLRSDGSVARLDCASVPLGVLASPSWTAARVRLEPGDLVVIVSDGVTEADAPDGEEFGEERLIAALASHADEPIDQLRDAIVSAVRSHAAGAPQRDDITLLVARGR